jgi:hypothetical protein
MSTVGELDRDVMDCGGPEATWKEMVRHLRWRAANSRGLSRDRQKDAEDAADDAQFFAEQAAEFEQLANALERASVTFASGIETEGHDPEGHGAKHESPAAEGGDAQKGGV